MDDDRIPHPDDVPDLLRRLPAGERNNLLWAVDTGRAALDPAQAAIAVAVARHRIRRAWRLLPLHVAFSLALSAALGFGVSHSSAGFAFALLLSGILLIGWMWWGDTLRPRMRAEQANLAVLDLQPPSTTRQGRAGANEWLMAATLAWVASMAFAAVLHVALGLPAWVGLPAFVVVLVLARRLLASTVEQIDEWGNR